MFVDVRSLRRVVQNVVETREDARRICRRCERTEERTFIVIGIGDWNRLSESTRVIVDLLPCVGDDVLRIRVGDRCRQFKRGRRGDYEVGSRTHRWNRIARSSGSSHRRNAIEVLQDLFIAGGVEVGVVAGFWPSSRPSHRFLGSS